MSTILESSGGRYLFDSQYVRLTRGHLHAAGGIANQALFNLVLLRLLQDSNGPVSGVFGDDLLVSEAGGVVTVASGLGLLYTGDTDPHGLAYRPIVLSAAVEPTLAPASALLDRIDVISIAPADVDDTPETVQVRGSSGLSPQSLDTRRRFAAEVKVTTGLVGVDPEPPATPAGHLKLAEVRVLAADAGYVVTDFRPILTLGTDARPVPGEDYVVQGLSILRSGGDVFTGSGIAEFGGYRYRYPTTKLVPVENATGATRYDLIVIKSGGTVEIIEGGGTKPTAAEAPEGTIAVGYAVIPDGGTAASDAQGFTLQKRPIGYLQIQNNAIDTAHILDTAVTGPKILDGAVTEDKLQPNAVTETKIADGAVITEKLADGAVTEDKLATVTRAHTFPGSAFVHSKPTYTEDVHSLADRLRRPSAFSGPLHASCAAHLPQDATVLEVVAYVTPEDPGAIIVVELKRENLVTGTVEVMATVEYPGVSTGRLSVHTTAITNPEIDNTAYSYWLKASIDGGAYNVDVHAVRVATTERV